MVYLLTFIVKINGSLGKDTSLMDPMRVNHHFKPQKTIANLEFTTLQV